MHPHPGSLRPLAILGGLVVACVLGTSTVTVEAGDTLTGIAARHDVTVDQLVDWNELEDPDLILAGTKLVVSPPQDEATVGTVARRLPTGTYTVSAGDTLFAIARFQRKPAGFSP